MVRLLPRWVSRLIPERPPATVRSGLPAEDRFLGWAELPDKAFLAATVGGLWRPEPNDKTKLVCIPWHFIDKAIWRGDVLTIIQAVEIADGVVEELPPQNFTLLRPHQLPSVVRDRVTNSVRHSSYHPLLTGGGVRVTARRKTGQDGLLWFLLFDPGVDRHDPVIQAEALEYLAKAKF